ncbi:alpha/beta fold hydrolase [Gordonia neofelifaecis]|uniref:PHB de-polymerase domain protein n=1 Tax=Gordonia neofelifaecis NRRL B-59395 TaxID=644548 RepID=F1YPA1_9ACTN|nr:alpha/beta fold hydrolase [Gordonia neofelifaecis]EGD53496.1 PHB de-polymerase domain protein [Gordonia neofelifaecis NRRL B-59395]
MQDLKMPVKIWSSIATAPMQVATATALAGIRYWSGAFERRATPLDVMGDWARWVQAATVREVPPWAHDHTVVREWPVARLLDYSAPEPGVEIATLVLPPQAGHSSSIVDFNEGQSQMITIRDAGLDRLYTLDWLGATQATKDYSIEDYISIVDEAVDDIGGIVNLIGDCQGGWLATIYAALRPDKVNSLTIGGAPIDFHIGDGVINEWVRVMRAEQDTAVYRGVVAAGNGVYRGQNQVLGFKMLEPAAEYERLVGLLPDINDERAVKRYTDFTNWFEWTQDIPGAFYLWIVEHLFGKNELVNGQLAVGGETVDLARISCPVNLLAGSADHITPPVQVWALEDYVSTPKDQIKRELAQSGHLGLFMGRESLASHWAPMVEALVPISR